MNQAFYPRIVQLNAISRSLAARFACNAAAAMLELSQWAKKHKVTGPRDLSTNDEYLYGKLALDYPLRGK